MIRRVFKGRRKLGGLVLTRKPGEAVILEPPGLGITITIGVVMIDGDKVRVSIDAPRDWPVHRDEVYDAIKRAEADQGGEK